jgi:hypothetical protein
VSLVQYHTHRIFMSHILEHLSVWFVGEVFAASFSVVALYVIIALLIVRITLRKHINEIIRELMKRFLFKFPFIVTGYGFLAGVGGYIGIALTDLFVDGNIASHASGLDPRPRIVLVLFTLFGMCFGTLVGLQLFIKSYKTIRSSSLK